MSSKPERLMLRKFLQMKNSTTTTYDLVAGERIDQFLSNKYPEYSRAYFQNLIENGSVTVNRQNVKSSTKLKAKDKIVINFTELQAEYPLKPAKIKLNIVFENEDVIVINKPPGMVVHPAAGNKDNTLVNALVNYFPKIKEAIYDKDSEVSKIRPGLVHRLDKDTSGLIIVAKNARAMHSLSRQIQNRNVVKKYLAVCYGWPKSETGTLTNYLGRHSKNRKLIAEVGETRGKIAISKYKLVKTYEYNHEKISLIEFDIKTGRTHQIRVQAKLMGNPVLGDEVYGSKDSIKLSKDLNIERQLLHAKELTITLPGDSKPSVFEAKLTIDFENVISHIT